MRTSIQPQANLVADAKGALAILNRVPAGARLIASGSVVWLVTALEYSAERYPDCRRVPGLALADTEAAREACFSGYARVVQDMVRQQQERAAPPACILMEGDHA